MRVIKAPVSLGQSWRTYGTRAQNGRRKISLARAVTAFSIYISLAREASLYCEKYM
jgi:hypothetical protein